MQDQSAELARLPQIDQQGSIGGARVLADHRRRCIAASDRQGSELQFIKAQRALPALAARHDQLD